MVIQGRAHIVLQRLQVRVVEACVVGGEQRRFDAETGHLSDRLVLAELAAILLIDGCAFVSEGGWDRLGPLVATGLVIERDNHLLGLERQGGELVQEHLQVEAAVIAEFARCKDGDLDALAVG